MPEQLVRLCRGNPPRPAVLGPHLHWNGAFYARCHSAERCAAPSCHTANSQSAHDRLEQWREEHDDPTLGLPSLVTLDEIA